MLCAPIVTMSGQLLILRWELHAPIVKVEDALYVVELDMLTNNCVDMNNEFIDGIWFAVQHIVVVRDMPAIAAGIIKESDLSIDDCKAAQKRSGSFHNQMMKFIKTELA